jgi:hypothetical protein
MPGPDEEATASTPDFSRRIVVGGRVIEMPTAEAAARAIAEAPERLRGSISADSAEAADARRLRREFGDRPLAAGTAGAARGATLGLSDVLARAVGGEEAADYLARLEAANPEASMVGDVVGSVAPVLASGGLGLEARAGTGLLRGALGAVGAPTRALAGLSEAVGGAVGRRLGGGLLARGVGVGVEGAIEGGVGEIGRMLSERALGTGDPDLTAEMVLARLGTGALMGGAAGGLLGTGAAALARGARATTDAASDVLRRGWGDAVGTELSPTVARAWSAIADAGEGGADAIRRFGSLGEEGRRLRRLIESGDEIYEAGTRNIGARISTMEEAQARVFRYWREGLRTDELVDLVDGSLIEAQATSARSLAAGLRDRAEALATDFAGSTVGGRARGLRGSLDRRIADIELAIARGDARSSAEINGALNAIKRDVDAMVAASEGMGPAAAALRDSNDALRRSLEDAGIWGGRAATAQREINEAFSSWLTTRQRFAQQFTVRGASEAGRADFNPYLAIPEANSSAIRGFLGGVGTAANETSERTFRESVEAADRLLEVMNRNLSLDPAARAAVGDARRASEGLLDTYRRVRSDASDLNQWRALESNRSVGRQVVGGFIGSALGGPLGALAATAATSPAQIIRGMGLLERWTSGAAGDISASLGRFMRAGRDAVAPAARRTRTAAVLGTVRAYQERTRRLEEEAATPRRAVERITAGTAGMDVAPSTRNAMIATATRANAYLSRVRPTMAVPGELVPNRNRAPSRSDMARFLRVARVVDEPLTLLEDLANGTISPDSVAAVREVYPRLYEHIRSEAVRYAAEEGDALPYDRRVLLGVLLDAPTVPSLVPAVMAQMQALYSAQHEAAPASATRPAPRISNGMASGAEALERRSA